MTQSSPELGGLVDVLLTHYVKPFDGNYEHIVNSLKSERIVIECTANNQQEANSAALLLSIIKSELTAAKISERSTFRSVFPVSILQFDTSDISESELSVIGWVMRLTRKRAIAPFVSVDNVNNVLAESASHKITSTGQENEYCVEYMGNKMIVNAEVI